MGTWSLSFAGRRPSSAGQIYVKMLPDGEPVQLTHDDLPKMAPVFSPDASRIAYTITHIAYGWDTWVVPVLGGEPQQLLPNASALTWVDRKHVVFSEIGTGVHMGIATATESRAEERAVYLPGGMAGMAHRSWVSPDGKWILVSEMDMLGGSRAVCFLSMGAPAARQPVRGRRGAPMRVGARMAGRCTLAPTLETGTISGASAFREEYRNK